MRRVRSEVISGRVVPHGRSTYKVRTYGGRPSLSFVVPTLFADKPVQTIPELHTKLAEVGIDVTVRAVRWALLRRPDEYALINVGKRNVAFQYTGSP